MGWRHLLRKLDDRERQLLLRRVVRRGQVGGPRPAVRIHTDVRAGVRSRAVCSRTREYTGYEHSVHAEYGG